MALTETQVDVDVAAFLIDFMSHCDADHVSAERYAQELTNQLDEILRRKFRGESVATSLVAWAEAWLEGRDRQSD